MIEVVDHEVYKLQAVTLLGLPLASHLFLFMNTLMVGCLLHASSLTLLSFDVDLRD